MHPADRQHRRLLAQQSHERYLARLAQREQDETRRLDRKALDEEWDHTLFTITSSILAFQASNYLDQL